MLFGRVTLAGVALNLVAIPLMSVLQTGAMAALALSTASRALAAGSGLVAHWAAVGILESARLTDMAPWLAFDVPAPRAAVVAVYYAAAVCWLAARSVLVARGAAVAGAAAAAAMVAGPAWAANVLDPPAAGVRVVVLDVGQGDATAIVLPGGRAVLVDAGGAAAAMPVDPAGGEPGGFDIGQRVVVPALRALGVRGSRR